MMSHRIGNARCYYRRDAASAYLQDRWGLRCRPKTLAKLAVYGGGPPMHYSGRWPVYSQADLDTWAVSRMTGPFTSTTDRARDAKDARHHGGQ